MHITSTTLSVIVSHKYLENDGAFVYTFLCYTHSLWYNLFYTNIDMHNIMIGDTMIG